MRRRYARSRMARTKNANYGCGESPNDGGENLERRIVVAGSRVVYEDPTDSEQEGNSSRTVSNKDSTCEKDGDVEKIVEKGVERSPTTDDDTTVDIGMSSNDGDEAICGGEGDLEVESAKILEPTEIPTEDATKDATEERTIQRTFTRKRKRNPSGAVKTPYTRWPTRRRNAD